jgi:uncharacterized protein (TIGR02996 family)
MVEEADFLREIQTNPRDRSTRLVFADWLEERADPRHELIRVEEEMDRLPAFADRFWELKPRRNKLRASADPEWLAALGYGTVCRPLFGHGWPDDVKGRWRLIREFRERWHGRIMRDAGRVGKEIREVEGRLRRTLPDSLREWVSFAHDAGYREDRDNIISIFGNDCTMGMIEGSPALSFLRTATGYYQWAVRLDQFDRADPPACAFTGDPPTPEVTDQGPVIAERLSSFVLAYLLADARGEGGNFTTVVDDRPLLIRHLETSFPARCQFDRANVLGRPGEMTVFEADDIRVEVGRSLPEPRPRSGPRPLSRWRDPASARDIMIVRFARPMPDSTVPPFLWDYARRSQMVWGPNGRDQGLPNFHDLVDDEEDIPF